jgi:Na+/alanine symporter
MLVLKNGKIDKAYPLKIMELNNVINQDLKLLSDLYSNYYLSINDPKITNSDKNILSNQFSKDVESFKTENIKFKGKSLVSSSELTAKAFSKGILGDYGGKLVAIALLLFAFSTAITWCYYGDRSTAYIFGEKSVFWYRNFYVLCFVLAAVIDTTIVWNIAYVVVALVSIPNLIALFILRKEMKQLTNEFVEDN